MNLKISKWANVVGKVKMSLCDWGPAMANVLSSNRDKNLSWPSEAWTQKSEEHGRALIYTKGSGRRGHDGDEKGDTESPRASLLVFAVIPLRDLQNKWVSSRRRKWNYLRCLLWLQTAAQTHTAEGIIQEAYGFWLMEKISPFWFLNHVRCYTRHSHCKDSQHPSPLYALHFSSVGQDELTFTRSIRALRLVQWDWTVGGISNENQERNYGQGS